MQILSVNRTVTVSNKIISVSFRYVAFRDFAPTTLWGTEIIRPEKDSNKLRAMFLIKQAQYLI